MRKVENSNCITLHLFKQERRHFFETAILHYLTDKSKADGKVAVVAKKRVRSCFII